MTAHLDSRARPVALIGLFLGIAMGLGLSVLALANRDPYTESLATAVPLIALVFLPPILGLIGLSRPPALLAAFAATLPLTFLSLAGATLPLLIPALLYLVAYGLSTPIRSRVFEPLLLLFAIGLGAAALVTTWGTSDSTVCSKTIEYPDGRVVHERSERPGSGRVKSVLGTTKGGGRAIEESCAVGIPGAATVGLTLAVVALGIGAIGWASKPRIVTDRALTLPSP